MVALLSNDTNNMPSAVDISKLSYTELKKLLDEAQAAINDKKEEELKVLADGYVKKLQGGGFSIKEGIEALRAYLPTTQAARTQAAPRSKKAYVPGTVYCNPTGTDTWVGGAKGQLPKWLKAAIAGLENDALAAKFASLAKK